MKELLTFWDSYQDKLKAFYPGITWERWACEAQSFCSQGREGIEVFLAKAQKGVPLEYITSRAYFYKSEFFVTPDVLIPRSETEILVEKAVEICRRKLGEECTLLKVADIGTGSGAIIFSLALDLNFHIDGIAVDICGNALGIAKKNYFLLKPSMPKETRIRFLRGDRLDPIGEKLHLILSNPPYIKESAGLSKVHAQVLKSEPRIALFLKDEEYNLWYKEFLYQIRDCLYPGGVFLMEGHEDHLQEVSVMAQKLGFEDVQIWQDYTERERFLMMRKPR